MEKKKTISSLASSWKKATSFQRQYEEFLQEYLEWTEKKNENREENCSAAAVNTGIELLK